MNLPASGQEATDAAIILQEINRTNGRPLTEGEIDLTQEELAETQMTLTSTTDTNGTTAFTGNINFDQCLTTDDGEYIIVPVQTEDGVTQNALVPAAAAQSLLQQQMISDASNVMTIQPEQTLESSVVKQEPIEEQQQTVEPQSGNLTTVITAFVCPVCGMTFQRRAALMSHGKIHPEFQNHKCTICNQTFTRLDFVKRHVRSHLGFPHECEECHRSFKEPEELSTHKVNIHMRKRKIHSCSVCQKVLKNAFNLKEHMRVHTGDKPFLCDACPMRFARSVDLRNHQFVHKEDLRYFCHICGKRFRRPEGRRIHLRNHLGVKPYKCTVCDKGFASRSSYNIHMKNHHRVNTIKKIDAAAAAAVASTTTVVISPAASLVPMLQSATTTTHTIPSSDPSLIPSLQ